MVVQKPKHDETIAKRRDAALRRALTTPPKPKHEPVNRKDNPKPKVKKPRG